jgi:hypothetical protein
MIQIDEDWIRARALAAQLAVKAPPVLDEFKGTARIMHGVTIEQYHADPCKTPSLNSSTAQTIVERSPLHAYAEHPRLGGLVPVNGTVAKDEGSILHTLILGRGKELAIIDAPDWRTKEARERRELAISEKRLPVLSHVYSRLVVIAEKLRERCRELNDEAGRPAPVLFDGQSEVPIEWTDDGVLCRSMIDHLWLEEGRIIDLKKFRSAAQIDIERNFIDYGMDVQYACYTRALARLRPELAGRVDMAFLICEVEPPYSVVLARPDGALREIGALRWERARRIWKECLATKRWPGYSDRAITLNAPPYIVQRELGEVA